MYEFCRNSPYYEMVVENISKEKPVQEIEDACDSFSNDDCSLENPSGKEICKKILYMYEFLDKVQRSWKSPSTITNEDLNFLNYWLNVKLKDNTNASVCISKFNETINSEGNNLRFRGINLKKHLNVIDRGNLENMELLCELYRTKQKIFDIMIKEDCSNNVEKLCPEYTEKCHKRYIEGIDKCLDDYDDFYKALKKFKYYYKYGIEKETDTSGYCYNSEYFRLPEYDPVLERKQKKIMLIQNITTSLMVLLIIPLLYKFTPFGSFLRGKIKMVKDVWVNQNKNGDELLSLSTDIEDNNSDNGEYNIGYYSGKN
ncbi:PIR Superfamily Protein [Plasmodium ovale wallikeri]|uniref:PIR Superfamily Protein n=1 Tax=Plasmodium ovale wallikeri TaxID=864142 RepID=A0A1A9A7Q9_PLAOA|nr:PIR Superfamily Protein [Plasmodium ovale wallikeri]